MEGKFASEGLQAIDGNVDMLTAMTRELVKNKGIGESADSAWRALGQLRPSSRLPCPEGPENSRLEQSVSEIPSMLRWLLNPIRNAAVMEADGLTRGSSGKLMSKASCRCSDEPVQAEPRPHRLESTRPTRAIYTGSSMQIPWYIGWPIAIAFAVGILFMIASRASYYPIKYPGGFWEQQSKLGAEDVWLLASDGVRLHAWWVKARQASLATLYLHGNAGNLTHRFLQILEITAGGSSVLMLDYRGYGKSGASPSENGLYADADAAYLYLLDHGYSARHIVLQGESLGTAVAVDLASRKECAGVVLEAAFTSGRDVANTVLPLIGPLVFRGFDSKSKIAKIRAPLLFFHGDRDEIIPLKLGRSLFEAAPKPKWFIEIPEAGHNDLVATAGSSYRERLHEFYGHLQ
jgi:fermentation-respiration switch protein FrsA (DUF1100 family)